MDRRLRTHSEHILVIAKDEVIDRASQQCLSNAGYAVDCTVDFKNLANTIAELSPDLIVLDLCSDGEGVDVLKTLQETNEQFPQLPVIVFFDASIEPIMVDALKLGILDYMLKPLNEERLLFSVHGSLERARLENENRDYAERLETANRELEVRLEEIQSDQQAGRLVQQKMQPLSPAHIFDFEFEHIIIPANYLSGDFIDYHQVSDNKLVFYLVDVTGHGSSSAFVTVLIKQLSLRSQRHFKMEHHHEVKSASWMLSWINRNLLEASLDCHATIFLGVIDAEDRTLNYSYGGHFPQAIFASPDTTCFLKGRGLPLGLFDEAEYEDHYIELPKDFSITLLSDGVLEIVPEANLSKKEQRLLEIVQDSRSSEGDDLNAIFEALKFDELHEAPDDISVLSIRSREQS